MAKKIVLQGKVSIDALENIFNEIKTEIYAEKKVVLDCSSMSAVDTAGMQMFLVLAKEAFLGNIDLIIEGQIAKNVSNRMMQLGILSSMVSDGGTLKTALLSFIEEKTK